jgi:hypothetical protein
MIGDSNKITPALLFSGFWTLLRLFDLGTYLKRGICAMKVHAIITNVCHYKLPCLRFSNKVIILDIIRFDIDTFIQEHIISWQSKVNILFKFMYLDTLMSKNVNIYIYIFIQHYLKDLKAVDLVDLNVWDIFMDSLPLFS